MDAPRLRFAPSPSGYLHIGGARTALFCWLLAKRYKGTFILRIEDTDAARSTEASIQAILDGLQWLGLDWDEGPGVGGPHAPYSQSGRGTIYQQHIDRLIESGDVYRCYCTKEELDAKREAAQHAGHKPAYDRTCRELSSDQWPDNAPYVLRLKAPLDGETVIDDLVRGRIVIQNKELSDQVVVRSNGDPLYNFVVVVDDATMEVSHVVRGDDHLSNTPKQIQIYQALGYEPPQFAHLPLILGQDKKRLSKRHGATNVMQYDEEGYFPDAVVNFLARLGWSHKDQELFTRQELIDVFGLEAVGKSPGVWNPEKLDWVNAHWLRQKSNEELAAMLAPRIVAAGHPSQEPDEVMAGRIATLTERAKTLADLLVNGSYYWADEVEYTDEKARRKFMKPEQAPVLHAAHEALLSLDETHWAAEAIEEALGTVLSDLDLSIGKLAQPLRVAITGSTRSPGIFVTLEALGRDKTLARIQGAAAIAAANTDA
ncbi:MAG: glutamate--tRNA ligase [Myxococcota bacterium]|nr:glutamate--tRNA ligase [Myxococcota bacterium]